MAGARGVQRAVRTVDGDEGGVHSPAVVQCAESNNPWEQAAEWGREVGGWWQRVGGGSSTQGAGHVAPVWPWVEEEHRATGRGCSRRRSKVSERARGVKTSGVGLA